MKNWTIIILLCLLGTSTMAQRKQQKPLKKDNFLIDVHYSSLINAPKNITFDFGYGASFQFLYDHQFKSKFLSGAIGLAYSNDNYFSNGYLSQRDSINGEYSTFYPWSTLDSSVKRSRYITNYLDIPVEVRFRSKPNEKGHSWKASVGFRVGFRLGSRQRVTTSDGRFETFNYNSLRRLRYGVTGRFGYGRMGLVYYYSISRLFEDNAGHELIPWSLGITISPF